ncbi:MAG: hypothetical protein Kow0010_10030 [Dehalococcoidia bacterium]
MAGNRRRAHHQLGGDLLVGEAPREQQDDIDLAGRKAGDPWSNRCTEELTGGHLARAAAMFEAGGMNPEELLP